MTTVSGFHRLGLAEARTVAAVRAVLDPAEGAAPIDVRALDSNHGTLAELDRAAERMIWRSAAKLQGRCEADAAYLLGLNQPDNTRRLRAIVSRAYAQANVFAFHLARKVRDGAVYRDAALVLDRVVDLAGRDRFSLDLLDMLERIGLGEGEQVCSTLLHRLQAGFQGLADAAAVAQADPIDTARLWFVWRMAEAFAASTGRKPGLYRSGEPEGHKRSQWMPMLETALGLTGLGREHLDRMLRSLNGSLPMIGGGQTVDLAAELETLAGWLELDEFLLPAGNFQSEGVLADVHALEKQHLVPASETRFMNIRPPRNASEGYADPFAY